MYIQSSVKHKCYDCLGGSGRRSRAALTQWLLAAAILLFTHAALGGMPIAHTGVTHYIDHPEESYEVPLVVLALEKTRGEYGDYTLVKTERGMTQARLIEQLRRNEPLNLVRSLGYRKALEAEGLRYIPFPIYRGLLSYRTCLVNDKHLSVLNQLKLLEDLQPYRFGFGIGWADIEVFRHNRLTALEISSVDSLAKMTARGRIDFFCRGASEVKTSVDDYAGIRGITYDQSLMLYYPMPVFLYTHKDNAQLLARLTLGLQRAYEDGSLMALWWKNFREGLAFQKLDSRTLIRLENPEVQSIPFDYERYFYHPSEKY